MMQSNNCKYIESYREKAQRIIDMPMKLFHERYGNDVKVAYEAIKRNSNSRPLLNSLDYLEVIFEGNAEK